MSIQWPRLDMQCKKMNGILLVCKLNIDALWGGAYSQNDGSFVAVKHVHKIATFIQHW